MPNTFTQIYIQVVFAVNGRQSLVTPSFKGDFVQVHWRHNAQRRPKAGRDKRDA